MNRWLVLVSVGLFAWPAGAQQDPGPETVLTAVTQGVSVGKISGVLWSDLNGNAKKDSIEPGIAGWTVHLSTGQTAVTGLHGEYTFANLAPGVYRVTEDSRPAWFQTFPAPAIQAYPLAWARAFQGQPDGTSECVVVDTDPNGEFFGAGHFSGTVDFDPSDGVDLRTAVGGQDIFVSRFKSDGTRVWVRTFGDGMDEIVTAMKVDSSSGIILAGSFQFDVDFDPGQGKDVHTAAGVRDAFVTRLKADGSYGWTTVLGGPDATVTIRGLCLNTSGDILLTGSFSGSADFDPGAGVDVHTAPGDASAFVTKLHSDGSYGWTRTFGGSSYARGGKVVTDPNGGIYVAGDFQSTVNFVTTGRTEPRSSSGDCDIFIIGYDSQGNSLWTRTVGGADWDRPFDICLDAAGNIYVTGVYSLWVNFNPTGEADWRYTPNYHVGQCFVMMMRHDGRYGWTTTIGDATVRTAGMAVRVDPSGQILVAGEQTSSDALTAEVPRSDLLVAGLSQEGKITWMRQWPSIVSTVVYCPGTGAAVWSPWPWGLTLSPAGDVLLSGRFNAAVDWSGTAATAAMVPTGAMDGFLTKLSRTAGSYSVSLQAGATATGCDFGNIPR
jgi:hypothetical protein